MGIRFNADEVFEMAAEIERNGAAFYRKAAESNPEACGLLLEIAAQDEEHLATFEQLRKDVTEREAEPTASDPDGEGALYLKAMADAQVFEAGKNPTETLKGDESLEQVISIAMGKERESIVFYLGIKECVPRNLGDEKIMKIIREEMKHIRWLSGKLTERC